MSELHKLMEKINFKNTQVKYRIPQKKENKYKNQKITYRGIKFDSQKEAYRYNELKILEDKQVISNLKLQQSFLIVPKQKGERAVHYIADFTYFQDGKFIVEDVKSEITRKNTAYIIKRKLVKLLLNKMYGENAEFREV